MKIYIQSRSGDYNREEYHTGATTLAIALERLRKMGGYTTEYRDKAVFVPFEEIRHIQKVGE
jgi:hypothetical protein